MNPQNNKVAIYQRIKSKGISENRLENNQRFYIYIMYHAHFDPEMLQKKSEIVFFAL